MDISKLVDNYLCDQETFSEFIIKFSKLNFDDSKYTYENIDKLYDEFYVVKRNLRLLINKRDNFESFKDCQSLIEESEIPSFEQLKEDFIRCITSLIKFEKECQRKEMPAVEQCTICDTRIEPDDENCSMCGESVWNMPTPEISSKRKLSNNRIDNDTKRPKIDNVPNKINIKSENEKLDSTNTNNVVQNMETQNGKDEPTHKDIKTLHDILNKNQNQWICKTCECLNQFNLVNCQACDADCKDNGYWICCNCSCVNEMSNDICSACNTNNELIVPANKWKCWKPVCNVLNDDKFRFCHKCGLQRTRPIPFSDLVERKVKGKINKFWICEKCWQYNNNDKLKCPKNNCGEPRFNQTSKITDKTNIQSGNTDLNCNKDRTGDSDLNHNKDRSGNTDLNCNKDRTGNTDLNHNKDRTGDSDLNHNKDRSGNTDLNRNKDRTIPGNPEKIRDNTSNNLKENGKGKVETTQKNHPNIDRNVVETEWKCWNNKCETINKIKHYYCQECKLDRNPPDPETQLVKSYAGNIIREIWICRKCEKHNPKDKPKCEGKNCGSFIFYTANDCKDNKNKAANPNEIKINSSQWECDKCTFVNNGKEKCCTVCNSERNNDTCPTSSSWKCWFKNCRQTNDNQYEFCQHCTLYRFGNRDSGKLVKCQDKNGIKEIWICQKCFKYNSLSNQICSGKNCDNSRF